MKDRLSRKIMTKFVRLRGKTFSYLISDNSEGKKTKDTKKCVIKKSLNVQILKTV